MRIIPADDDEELRFILARMLGREGYEIEEIGDIDSLRSLGFMLFRGSRIPGQVSDTALINEMVMNKTQRLLVKEEDNRVGTIREHDLFFEMVRVVKGDTHDTLIRFGRHFR